MYDPDDESGDLADDEDPAEAPLVTEAEVVCPSCGETVTLQLDPGGGTEQDYLEDCEVCCRPMRVRVSYDEAGAATVLVEPAS